MALEVGDRTLLVDPGPGAVHRAVAAGLAIASIDTVLLTHHHPDHCLDLVALLFARVNPYLEGRLPSLTVHGGLGTKRLVSRLAEVFGEGVLASPRSRVTIEERAPGPFRCGAIRARAFAIRHSRASLAYRLRLPNGATVAFSGDTAPCAGAIDAGRRADLYVLEAALPDSPRHGAHLAADDVVAIAKAVECRHLVLNHFYPQVDLASLRRKVRAAFGGRLTLARDGLVIPLPAARRSE
jgi:ribonuclease BN (tRNA processing enzyme)